VVSQAATLVACRGHPPEMYRSIPVANKACADRIRSRNHELHKERIRKMRPQVDTTIPSTLHLDHLRNNLKREQLLEERYHEIDRENRILLQKMSDTMKQQSYTPRARSAGASLNRDARKTELMRITQENGHILKRIQQAQPVYNHISWEDSYRKSATYLKNTAEYPLCLRRKASRASSLTPMSQSGGFQKDSRNGNEPGSPDGAGNSDDLKYVFKEGKKIGARYYLIEMATDGRTLAISAYEGDQQKTLELVVNERNHRRIYRELHGDYSLIADKLRIDGDHLVLDSSGGPLDGGGSSPDSAAARNMASTA